ncbi:hypothetical protein EST38_g2390 [Candolleomyces aberdarensis]|uniref:RlpA-like protein double-psi beta-barrel domain-containing protein n=1 Tax=Candolleomyces aberdarensis TaxID=2316362 RepID=A0A4Q2DTQ0_9AGAR|nr:hypothetical protein EST38_g2390 [Candolleomyces aberdarensis]
MSFTKCLVLVLSVVASVNALATPHAIRHSVHHRSIAARAAEPRSANVPVLDIAVRAPANRRRCRPRPTGSTSVAVTPTTSVPINAAPIPSDTPTSSTRAPEPTTTRPPQTTTRAAPTTNTPRPTTTSRPPATTSASNNNGGGGGGGGSNNGFLAGTQSGQGTFYDTGLGACGRVNRDTDLIAAVSMHLFDNYPGAGNNPNNNPVCGKRIRASRGGSSVTITVVDRCVGCAMTDLDFSPSAFDALTGGNRGLGRVQITWEWA